MPAAARPSDDEPIAPRQSALHRVVAFVITYGVVVAIFVFLIPKMVGGTEDVIEAVQSIRPVTWVAMLVLGVVNLATNWPPMAAGLPGLRLREAGVSNTASAALSNTVPEGGAVATGLTFSMQKSWGFRVEAITLGFLATGVWTNLVRYGLLAVALVLWGINARSWDLLGIAVLVSVVMLAAFWLLIMILRSERFARWFGRLLGRLASPYFRITHKERPDFAEVVATFRHDLNGLLIQRWRSLTSTMIVSQLMAAFVLDVALRLQGIGHGTIPASQVYVAFAASALISLIFPVPGGLGVVEAALLAVLGWHQPDSLHTEILSAVIAYRVATWLLPIPIGAASYVFWRKNRSWRHTKEERAAALASGSAGIF